MSFYTGTHGRMEIRKTNQEQQENEIPQLYVRNWQVTTSISQLDATTLADTDKVPVNGIRTTRGSCQILYYKEQGKESNIQRWASNLVAARTDKDVPGQAAEARDKVWVHFYVNAAGSGRVDSQKGYKMYVNLTSFSIASAVGEVMSVNFQFECIGAPLEFNP